MIESVAYDIIKQEGIEAGMQLGLQKGLEQGIQKGIEQGMQKGLEQGIQKGIQEGIYKGIEQGREEGLLLEAREMVIDAVSERFDVCPPDVISAVNRIEQREILRALLKSAIRAKDIDEFREMLRKATGRV